jgi:hypothetical protein
MTRAMRQAIARSLRRAATPLLWYYAVAIVVPVANGAGTGAGFVEHAAFVLVLPLVFIALAGVGQALLSATLPRPLTSREPRVVLPPSIIVPRTSHRSADAKDVVRRHVEVRQRLPRHLDRGFELR